MQIVGVRMASANEVIRKKKTQNHGTHINRRVGNQTYLMRSSNDFISYEGFYQKNNDLGQKCRKPFILV